MEINRYILFLFIFVSLALPAMDKPPAGTIGLAPQELGELLRKEGTYFGLLPADLKREILQYALRQSTLLQAVEFLRAEYALKKVTALKFLNDLEFNTELIKRLADQFNESELMVAFALNTDGSFKWIKNNSKNILAQQPNLFGTLDDYKYFWNEAFKLIEKYLSSQVKVGSDYKHTIEYMGRFFFHMQTLEYHLVGSFYRNIDRPFFEKLVTLIAKRFYAELKKNYSIPELQITTDLATTDPDMDIYDLRKWYRSLLFLSDNELLENEWIKNYLKENYPKTSIKRALADFRNKVCEHFAIALLNALKANKHNQIDFLVTYLNSSSLDDRMRTCLAEKFKTTFGDAYVSYLDTLLMPAKNSKEMSSIKLDFENFFPDLVKQNRDNKSLARKLKLNQTLLSAIQLSNVPLEEINNLIKEGADINGSDDEGVTILMHAIKNKHIGVIRVLCEQQSINVNACDQFGHNALWYVTNLETDMATRVMIMQLLQNAGAKEETCVTQ